MKKRKECEQFEFQPVIKHCCEELANKLAIECAKAEYKVHPGAYSPTTHKVTNIPGQPYISWLKG